MAAKRLLSWFESNGVQLQPSVRIEADADGGLGLFATSELSGDTRVLRIPIEACISSESAKAAIPFEINVKEEKLPIVYLFLTAIGQLEKHKDYVDAIPKRILTPLHFKEKEIDLLRGTPLGLDLYRWSISAFNSRAFPPSLLSLPSASSGVLIPGLDLLNHAPSHPVTWVPTPTTVDFVTHYSLSPGDQVYNNYGPKSNEEFLGSYGFVLPESEDDFITLKLQGGKMHFWKKEAPEGLVHEIEQRLNGEGANDLTELEKRVEVLETLEVMLVQKRKAFRKAEGEVAAILAEQGHLATEEEANDLVRGKVWNMVEIYRNGQSNILNQAIKWTRNQLEKVADQLDDQNSD